MIPLDTLTHDNEQCNRVLEQNVGSSLESSDGAESNFCLYLQ